MAEAIYATPNMMTEARNTRGEREERIVDILVCPESLRDQQQDSVGTEESSKSLGTGRSQRPDAVSPPRCPIRAVVVLLGLLSVVLLARLLGCEVQHKTVVEKTVTEKTVVEKTTTEKTVVEKTVVENTIVEKTVSMDRDVEQLLQRLKNLTEQRDTLLCKQECPNGWDKFGCKCYMIYNMYLSWNKSREFCVSKGADLVVVDSKEEMDFIRRLYNTYFWLGATDEAAEGMWRWVDGTVLSLDNPSWSRGGPDGGEGQNCLKRFWDQNQFKWADGSCKTSRTGLCEHNLIK